jgi:GNAT superfamily N-acetyltransferase
VPSRLLVAHTPEEREAARRVEARVFLQAFGNTPELMAQEYGAYEARSRFVAVIDDESGDALGTARLITAGASPVKTVVDVAGEPWHLPVADSLATVGLAPPTVWDVASLAVDPRYRAGSAGAEVSLALCHGIWRYARNCGVPGLVTILDDRVRRLVRAMGLPWYPMAGATSQPYLGSPASTPCAFVMRTAEEEVYGARPDLAPSLDHGVFRSIAVDPADLLPARGTVVHETVPAGRPERSLPLRRDTTGWRPPTSRHADLSANRPGA